MSEPEAVITALLYRWREGDNEALNALTPLVYDNLRKIAASYISRERAGFTLAATEIVHEAYQRLAGSDLACDNRAHFLAIASRQMRQVLVDYARTKGRQKRGGDGWQRVTLSQIGEAAKSAQVDVLTIHDAIERLAAFDPRKAEIVDLMVFGGLKGKDVGEIIGIPEHTVWREWRMARAWLQSELKPPGE
jgi:RNA polymerase sigma-70 factor (ECF subfamily)